MRNDKPVINMGLFITNSSLSKGIKKLVHTQSLRKNHINI